MTPIGILALLGLAAFLPIFVDNDTADSDIDNDETDTSETDQPEDTDDPTVLAAPTPEVDTTDEDAVADPVETGDDLFATEESPTVIGGAGDDTLTSSIDGLAANLDGGAGDDTILTNVPVGFPDLTEETQVLTGGAGTDSFSVALDVTRSSTEGVDIPLVTVTDFAPGQEQLELVINTFGGSPFEFAEVTQEIAEDGSYTDLNVTFTDEDSDDLIGTVRLEGVAGLGDDQFTVSDGRELIEGTEGDDTLRSTDVDLGGRGEDTLSGLGGDDLLTQEPVDDAGAIVLEGGAGNDTILASEVEFSNPTTLDGGTGDDLLITELFTSAGFETVDTFITGEGADTVAISSAFSDLSGENDFVIVAQVTDFTPDEDIILIDTGPISSGAGTPLTQELSLTEDSEGGFTDVRYTVANNVNGASLSGTLRLEGVTGISEESLGFTLAELERGNTTSGVIGGTAGDDVISG
ncbi:calcium-binding protein [Sulfitobacter donghicola]|uniref:Calcium-binding protein n=1 Tax=Sulfitobacter donghicola DSW-25 = KCTC 12864 = JCM 14565 TaxID=1300350 RepID=A0A073IU12_9RHOB|nr:hypothetical protein [Sulfitobacter donghicola]KEJ88892.1 hypothetical protein DSW25_14290 [Sulfitobacter donghicola DSW-25 = KCTC 12864 = JCM 14565]KIN68605.1 hypothetical protein Z948_2336 [Sulfitobacter donghicola DSW-25 = KCTC 12864 = JCM 14565]